LAQHAAIQFELLAAVPTASVRASEADKLRSKKSLATPIREVKAAYPADVDAGDAI